MNESNFGNILREARERSGEDLMSVARKLRIRPDILESIEAWGSFKYAPAWLFAQYDQRVRALPWP